MTNKKFLGAVKGQKLEKWQTFLKFNYLPETENYTDKIAVESVKHSLNNEQTFSKWTKFSQPSSVQLLVEAAIKAWYYLLRKKGRNHKKAVNKIMGFLYRNDDNLMHRLGDWYQRKK